MNLHGKNHLRDRRNLMLMDHISLAIALGAGMVLRDDMGAIIFSACRFCSPMEAELAACLVGTSLALQRTEKPIIIKLDCKEGVEALNGNVVNMSSLARLIEGTKNLMHGTRRHAFAHVRHMSNMATHCMAQKGVATHNACTMVWLHYYRPDDLCRICDNECTNIT